MNDPATVDRLVTDNMRLVPWALRRILSRLRSGEDRDDLLQEGRLGLFRAAQDYDSSKGTFSTYARNWIVGYGMHWIRTRRLVRIPPKQYWNAQAGRPTLVHGEMVPVTASDLTEPLPMRGIPVESHEAAVIARLDSQRSIARVLAHLTKRQREVIVKRFGLEQTLREVGASMGYTREWARQEQETALRRMKERL